LGIVLARHATSPALVPATDDGQGVGQKQISGCTDGVTAVFGRICGLVVIADVVGVIVTG
jgi:hypothetical protein